MTISPINLQWGFATNAENTSVGVRNDGSIVSTFVSNSFLDYNISAAYGQLAVNNGTPGFTFWGTDWNFDQGDAPTSVAIDPTGLVVSVHTKNGVGDTLYLNVGSANGGQGGFSPPSYETSASGSGPCITCIGAGLFIMTAWVNNVNQLMEAWQVQVSAVEAGGYNVGLTPVTVSVLCNLLPGQISLPKTAYSNGVLAVIGTNPGGTNLYLGTYDPEGATFSIQYNAALPFPTLTIDELPAYSITFGPTGDLYFATAGENSDGNGTLYFYYGTITQGTDWNATFSSVQLFQEVNNGNYANAVDLGYITVGDYSGVVLAVLGETNCIDIFIIPSSQLTPA